MAELGADKRAIRRFVLHLPVTITASSGELIRATAETRDVSSNGICFYCDSPMPQGIEIEFMVTLPADVTMTEPINVRCHGKILRVEPAEDNRFAVAAAIDSYEFVANEEVATPKADSSSRQ